VRGGRAGAELWAADTNSLAIKPSLPSPDEMLQQVLSAAAGVCLPLPRSDMQRQQCNAMPRASSPTRREPWNPVLQPVSDPFVADLEMSQGWVPPRKDRVGVYECTTTAAPRPQAMQGGHDFTSELLQPTSGSCVSSTAVPPAHVGSASIEQSSVALSATSAKCSADVGGLGLSSYAATSLPTPTGEATQTTSLLSSGARLLAGAAADCLPNVGSMEVPTGDLPSLSTQVPSEACWRFALTSPGEAGLAKLPAGKATDQGSNALDAQLEVARMAEQAHRDGWLPEQAQQHVAWMAQQTMRGGPLEAAA